MKLRAILTATLAALALAGCTGQRDDVTSRRMLKDTSFERSWDLPFDRPVVGVWLPAKLSPTLEVTDTLLVQLDTRELVAVDAFSGKIRWTTPPLPEVLKRAPTITVSNRPSGKLGVTIRDVRVYVHAQDTLFCFEAEGGQLVWRTDTDFAAGSSPVVVGTESDLRCMLGDWNDRVRVLSLHPEKKIPYEAWQYNVQAPVTAAPVWAYERFFVGDLGGTVSCLSRDRDRAWVADLGGEITGPVAVRDRHVFAGTADGVFAVIQRQTGAILHTEHLGGAIKRGPLVFEDDSKAVFVWVEGAANVAGLYCFDVVADQKPPLPGEKTAYDIARVSQRWYVPGVATLAASSPEHLFVTDAAEPTVVKAISRSRGTVDWTWDADRERKAEAREQKADIPTVTKLIEYQDRKDDNRTFYVLDDHDQMVAYRFLGPVLPGSPEGTAGSMAPEIPRDTPTK